MIIDKINEFFNKKNKTNPCCYLLTTKKHNTYFFIHKDLSRNEKRINEVSLKKTGIVSIKQGKKLFCRFLKNNKIYKQYVEDIKKIKNNKIEGIIQNEFITPFFRLYTSPCIDNEIRDLYYKLEEDWVNILKSIRYIN